MDAVDPALTEAVERASAQPGVVEVTSTRLRWIGHRIEAEAHVTVDSDLSTLQSQAIAETVRHAIFHHVPKISDVTVPLEDDPEPRLGDRLQRRRDPDRCRRAGPVGIDLRMAVGAIAISLFDDHRRGQCPAAARPPAALRAQPGSHRRPSAGLKKRRTTTSDDPGDGSDVRHPEVTEPERPQGLARDDRSSRTADADPAAVSPVPEASRARHGNALRAGVLGSTDGLVSNLSLVMGVAGSGAPHEAIVVAGLAGLVAGSLSMALGEYLSVQSAREMFANELRIEAGQLAASPDVEVAELRGIYERKGVHPTMASELADHMVRSDPVLALDTMAREELGFDP